MTDTDDNLLSGVVVRKLHHLRRALRVRLLAEGLAWMVLGVFAAVLATGAIDYTLRLERPVRAVVTAAAAVGLVAVFVRQLLLPVTTPMNTTSLALLVERRHPSLADRLISAIQFSRNPAGVSEQMIRRLATEADEQVRKLDFGGIVERRRLFQLVSAAGCSAVLLVGLGIWQGDLMSRYLRRNVLLEDVNWPQKTYLSVRGEHFTVLRGEDLEVVVDLEPRSRVAPPHVTIHARYPSVGMTEQRVDRASPDAEKYVAVFRRVSEPFEFHVTGGDDRRDRRNPHRVSIVPAAKLEELIVVVDYPAYTQRPSKSYTGSEPMIVVPAGSGIGLRGRSGKDLRSAVLKVEGDNSRQVGLTVRNLADGDGAPSPRLVVGHMTVPPGAAASTLTLRLELTDSEGFVSRRAQQILCRVEPDTRPSVLLTCPPLGRNVTAQAVLPLVAEMEDDYGLTSARGVVRIAGADEAAFDEPVELSEKSARRLRAEHELDLLPHDLTEGRTLRVTMEAADNLPDTDGYGGPNVGVSGPLEFTVVSADDLLGEMVRRQKELRLEFVQAIATQTSAAANTSTAAELAATGAVTPEVRRRLGASAHLQQNVSAECAKTAQSLAGLLAQMRWNRIGAPADLAQLQGDVVEPLEALAESIENILAELAVVEKLSDAAEAAEVAERLAADQRKIVRRMEQIAEHMQKLQSRQDLARQLRMIIRMSEDLRERIRARQERGLIDIFEDDADENE